MQFVPINSGRLKLIWTLQESDFHQQRGGHCSDNASGRKLAWTEIELIQAFYFRSFVDTKLHHFIKEQLCFSATVQKLHTKIQYKQFYLTDSCQSHQAFPGDAAFFRCLKAHFKMVGCAMGHHQPSVLLS